MQLASVRYPEGPLLRTPSDLDVPDLATEEVRHVSTSRVALADYDLIQHDFPELNTQNLQVRLPRLARLSTTERDQVIQDIVDDWLVASAAYVSVPQVEQTVTNTLIQTDGASIGFRPPKYGRALVVSIQPDPNADEEGGRWPATMPGLLDIKGAGVAPGKTPEKRECDGLSYLANVLYDYVIKRAIDAIFEREVTTLWTVPVYAILDLGFDVVDAGCGAAPAGLHVRRAHRRVLTMEQFGPAYSEVTLEIERILRKYGLTAVSVRRRLDLREVDGRLFVTCDGKESPIVGPEQIGLCLKLLRTKKFVSVDRVDSQLARGATFPPASAQMYDFGTLHVERNFERPLNYMNSLAPEHLVWPENGDCVGPEPHVCLPFDTWNRRRLLSICHKLALQFRTDMISRRALREQLEEPLDQMVERWQRADSGPLASVGVG